MPAAAELYALKPSNTSGCGNLFTTLHLLKKQYTKVYNTLIMLIE